MKKKSAATLKNQPAQPKPSAPAAVGGKVHPVIIYPFKQPSDYSDLKALYQLIERLDADKDSYARPITV